MRIVGNLAIPDDPILRTVPFRSGDLFVAQRTNKLIQNVFELGYFRDVQVIIEPVAADQIDVVIAVKEKPVLTNVTFAGNVHLSEREIQKKIDFSKIPAIDTVITQIC